MTDFHDVPGLALFDLDNTLVDRLGAFTSWAAGFVRSAGGDPDDLAWLLETDDDGRTSRPALFDAARRRWNMAESVDALLGAYRRAQTEFYRPDPAVITPLGVLKGAGWRIVVVTNGSTAQHRKVERAGLADLVDAVYVSSEVGSAKPDPDIFLEACRGGPDDLVVMVGDAPDADIGGAHAVGLTTVWLDRGRPWPDRPFRPDHIVTTVGDAVEVVLALDRGHP
ncbi:MAG TPA: HAD family hydrolase [Acidimicrobiales bacterium]|nr:HAD family hydrolase [Acidimicrobiales bacterium]